MANVRPYTKRAKRGRFGRSGYKIRTLSKSNTRNIRVPRIRMFSGTTGKQNEFGFPQEMKVKLRYVDSFPLTSTTGGITSTTFRMNSLFDPDFTYTGHQPYGFDQWAALYTTYVVLGSKLTTTWSPVTEPGTLGTTGFGPWNVGTNPNATGTVSASNPTLNQESQFADCKVLGGKQGCNNIVQTVATYSPTKDLGLDPYDDTVSAGTGSNPSRAYYATNWVNDLNGTTSVVMMKVEIEFTVLFRTAVNQAQS